MRSFTRLHAARLCSGIALISLPAVARADEVAQATAGTEASSPAPVASNEIIVTATRQSQKLQEVPMAINVATGQDLQKFKIFDVKDVSQLAPGLQLSNADGRSNTTTLRGISFNPDQGTSPAVQIYYNEAPADAQTVFTAIYDIQQIEILRGPQGLLRGLSAPAGSITITTRKPKFDTVEGEVQATATDRGGFNVQGGVSLPIIQDKLALRVAGLVDGNRINHVTDVTNGLRSRSRTESGRVTLGWKPNSDVNVNLTYQYLTADNRQLQQVVGTGNTPYNIPDTNIPDTTVRSGPPLTASDYAAVQDGIFRSINDTHLLNLTADWSLANSRISFVGAHQYSKLKISRDLDAANALPGYVMFSDVVMPYNVNTAELRWASTNRSGLTWGVGAFYYRQTGTTTVHQDGSQLLTQAAPDALVFGSTTPNLFQVASFTNVPVQSTTWSFNGNLGYIAGPVRIEAGLRYSILKNIQTTQLSLSGDVTQPPTEIIPPELQRNVHKPVTGGVTVDVRLSPQTNFYVSYGHAYRMGTTGVATPAGISNDLVQTQPEQTDSIEAGFKGTAFDRAVTYSVSAFYQKINNYISRFDAIYYDAPDAQPQNAQFAFNYNGDATIKGVEAQIGVKPMRDWDFNVAASYTRARFKNAMVPCNTLDANGNFFVRGPGNVSYCKSNGRVSETPDFSLTANTELRFPIESAGVTPYIQALFVYTPGFYSERVDYHYQNRENLNLFVGIRAEDAKWELSGFVRNLLNQKRITNRGQGTGQFNTILGGVIDSGYRGVNVTNPREFGVTLSHRW